MDADDHRSRVIREQQQAPPPAVGTGSSIVDDLFGPAGSKDAGYLSTVFPAPPPSNVAAAATTTTTTTTTTTLPTGTTTESPYFGSSSVHYGGRDYFYAAGQAQAQQWQSPVQADKKKDDSSGSKQAEATRGDWWQGSLYY